LVPDYVGDQFVQDKRRKCGEDVGQEDTLFPVMPSSVAKKERTVRPVRSHSSEQIYEMAFISAAFHSGNELCMMEKTNRPPEV